MDKHTRFARISKKAFVEIALHLEQDKDTALLTIDETVIGYKNDAGAFIAPEAYKKIISA